MVPVRPRLFVVLYLLSGAAALLYEVAWLRLLTLTMGHTTGAVGAVLAAFMGGLAMPCAIGALRPLLALAYADGSGGALFVVTRLVVSVAVIALPGAAMGASFPVGVCVVSVVGAKSAKGAKGAIGARGAIGAKGARDVAELYAANTIGAAIGA